jgi:hypothetical protein
MVIQKINNGINERVNDMSEFARNKECDMCHKIEVGLVEIAIGKYRIMLCYDCMLKFINDMIAFKDANY